MLIMSPKKGGRPKREPTVPIQIKVIPALADALQRLADRNGHLRTQELILILEEKLKEEGMWPPKKEGE